jgi:integral membrane protein (TIGR01906 family)
MLDKLYSPALLLLLFTLPIVIIANLRPLYFQRFSDYHVYQNFQFPNSEVDRQFQSVLNYVAPPFNSTLDPKFFSSEDILHMRDVKAVLAIIYLIFFGSLIFVIVGLKGKLPAPGIAKYWTVFLGVIGVLGIISLLFWDQLFTFFHKVIFPFNDYWLLDPASSNLIKYFLNPIFQELFLLLICLWTIEGILLWIQSRARLVK